MPKIPKGLSDEKAARILAGLRDGKTPRLFWTTPERIKAYCAAHPKYGREALPLMEANIEAALLRKGARLRNLTHCKYGHSLTDAYVSHQAGYIKRDCRTCWALRQKQAGQIQPDIADKVEALLRRGAPVTSFTSGRAKSYLLQHKTFTRFRLENDRINQLFLNNQKDANSRGQRLRRLRIENEAKREQANEYYDILAMIPRGFPGKDDVVSAIFEDLLTGSLKRDDVRSRIQAYISAHNQMFPTKYRKFGGADLLSLDEVLFDDGTATRGDTVSRGLWD